MTPGLPRTASARSQRSLAAELRGVVSLVEGFPVLAGVDLDVVRGRVTLVSGPNGAGKTSLLRVLAGALPVSSGRAAVLGNDLAADARAHRDKVAIVGQDTGCYDDLTVLRNLSLHARAAGSAAGRAEQTMKLLGLSELAHTPHGRLSTGQRRRCALAVGLAREAELLLLDEPHAGLDAEARDIVDDAIRTAAASGTTVVLVSHELDRARALAMTEVRLAGGCTVSTSNVNSS